MVDRPILEAVLLDAGGTLLRLDFEWMADALREQGVDVNAAALRRGEVTGRRRYDASRGAPREPDAPPAGSLPKPLGSAGDARAYFAGMLEAAGVPLASVEAALERLFERQRMEGLWARPMEGAREALDALERMGLRLAVVSNSDGRAEQHLRDCGVLRGVEFVVDSHRVGIEKPDPGIFRIALDRLGVAPERALYVGDIRSVDEAGARGAGMRFALLDPYGDYAAPGTPAIRGIADLAAWISARVELPARARDETPDGARTARAGGDP